MRLIHVSLCSIQLPIWEIRVVSELDSDAAKAAHELLSNREYQVLCKIGSGKTVKETASELALSPKTVSTFRARILKKMKLKSTTHLIRYAVMNKLVD